jgi:hypothetical protein
MTKGRLSARFGDFNKPEITNWTHKQHALAHKGYWMGITRQGTFKMYLRKCKDDSYGVWVQEIVEG